MKTKWIVLISFLLFIISNLLTITNDLSSDGALIIGFPFTFYSTTNAKLESDVRTNFSYLFMILNIISFLAFVFIGNFIFKKITTKS